MFHSNLGPSTNTDNIPADVNPSVKNAPQVFLLLQGPHGPFFNNLARLLRSAGAEVWRCAFNAGDEYFWSNKSELIRHLEPLDAWPEHLKQIIAEKSVTDIVLYGDVRPIHDAACVAAERHGIRLHVFEEGYLRPYWISYERGGANGNSPLMGVSLAEMRTVLRDTLNEVRRPPAHWGDMRHHKFYGAFYHFLLLIANGRYSNYRSHRAISVPQEFRLNLQRFLMTPMNNVALALQWRRFRRSGNPYSLVLMQLEHDSNFLRHSPFKSNSEFVEMVISDFAQTAPTHHHLVFKAHPLEDGRAGNRTHIRESAEHHGVTGRVHYLRGGKLATMLSQARSVVTVNSTAAQQALWRGLPVKNLGRAVYDKPGLVSEQSLAEFFAQPTAPDPQAYRTLRDYLLQTSQIPGGFYSERSRAHTLRIVSDMILSSEDPYEALASGHTASRQQISDIDR